MYAGLFLIGALTCLHAATRRKNRISHKGVWVGIGLVCTVTALLAPIFALVYWFGRLTRRMSNIDANVPLVGCPLCHGTNVEELCHSCGQIIRGDFTNARCPRCGGNGTKICRYNHRLAST